MLERSRAYLENILQEKQGSALALLLRSPNHPDFELYLGQHAHPGSGALSRPSAADSLFDLASLTKILSTTCLLFAAESEGKFAWNDPVRKYFSDFPSSETTILTLLAHRSGLPAHQEFFRRYDPLTAGGPKLGDQRPLLCWIYEAGLTEPGKQVYSDLGMMLLGLLLESLYGKSLPELFHERIVSRLKLENAGFVTLPHAAGPARMYGLLASTERYVATEHCPWRKKTLQGEVHDDNTWALGGYAGHAGLFANARDTAALFEHLRRQAMASPDFRKLQPEGPGQFCFGFMTYPGLRPFPGTAFAGARGHTGFTGTSLWFHEPSQTLAILLGNRVHPSRSDDRFIQARLEFHKLLWDELGL